MFYLPSRDRNMTVASTPSREEVIEFTREMRERFLTQPPAEWKMEPTPENPNVYGVLMEWEMEGEGAITVAAFCEGSASVYTTTGIAMIGGHTDQVVRREARALIEAAGELYDKASPVTEFPFPEENRLQFYLLTFQGVRVIHGSYPHDVDGEGTYAPISKHGLGVFHRYLALDEQPRDDEDGSGYRKECFGPEGYVNCLLTSMSRGIGRSCVIQAGTPVPDLVALAAGNDRLQEWLAAQELPYASMDGKAVVRVIRKAARMRVGLPILTRHGEIQAIHVTEDGGFVACVYDVEIAPFDRSACVQLASSHDRRVRTLQQKADAQNAAAA
jgi:hypothetical protein